jgi:hypothetical protein
MNYRLHSEMSLRLKQAPGWFPESYTGVVSPGRRFAFPPPNLLSKSKYPLPAPEASSWMWWAAASWFQEVYEGNLPCGSTCLCGWDSGEWLHILTHIWLGTVRVPPLLLFLFYFFYLFFSFVHVTCASCHHIFVMDIRPLDHPCVSASLKGSLPQCPIVLVPCVSLA